MTSLMQPAAPKDMFRRALRQLESGVTSSAELLDTAAKNVATLGRLAEEYAAGGDLDGRVSIYTGETYAEGRDRWAAYRDLLVRHLRGPDGAGH